ncbi:MAG TPA: AAA family ATPase [Methanomassiliicoccales archaeon]|nr:AAA family ATPase [Methanomassiliicoccales archaeon]
MRTLFLGSVVERSGKTMVTLGLALNHPGKVGYYKPFRERLVCVDGKVVDQDAYLMRRLLKLKHSEEDLCPFVYDINNSVTMPEIVAGYENVECRCDTMLVEGTRDITTGYVNDVSGMAIAQSIRADVVLVSTANPSDLERIVMLAELLKNYTTRLAGVILNKVDDERPADILRHKGIKVLGSIPPLDHLKRYDVREVKEALDADVVVGEQNLDREVQRVMVGAMSPDTALSIMRRYADKAIITGGDRSDIQMAALATDTSCLILTGGLYPAGPVISMAYEKGVPILVTRHDTLEATEKVDHLIARIDPEDQKKIALVKKTVKEHVDLDALFR